MLVILLAGAACFITGIVLLLNPADDKNRRTFQVAGAILLLLLAFGLGLCSLMLRPIG